MAKVKLNLTLDKEVKDKIVALAQLEGKTTSAYIAELIEDRKSVYLDRLELEGLKAKAQDLHRAIIEYMK